MENREGEIGDVPPRSGRFFTQDGKWFFSTREGKPIGPFDSKEEAEYELDGFIDFISIAEPEMLMKYFKTFFREESEEQG